jgi:transcriptional regulator of acetoin/glycerol metabolism
VLRATGWNKIQAAKLLGISRATLDRKVSEYGLSRAAAFKEE